MKISFQIHEKFTEPEIRICADEMNENIKAIADSISQAVNGSILGYRNSEATPLSYSEIIRVFAQNQKTIAQTKDGTFMLHEKLYELESELEKSRFVRISKSELVNLKKVKHLDTSIAGTIKIYLQGDIETYVSRRNVTRIKKALGI